MVVSDKPLPNSFFKNNETNCIPIVMECKAKEIDWQPIDEIIGYNDYPLKG
ncbi:hypothetical protein [Fredinandcohnia quinoae]|uniref:Uncharacterized protein n=1 Tax=Fredinandcohnia quinoae TaxID=2918902 RepID=A0AAW5E4V3_9BACI|nr:hypothetical protein [Fredinandcohnia sp. SECRCQ15]MCH1625092.1 hypothetical protein [Fredinandcohnia sp. SECRCQ15]